MENKYQVSLNRLHTSIYSHCVYLNYSSSSQPFEEDIKTIQELIDNYSKLEKALDRACEELAMFSGVDVTSPLATAVYKYQCENCKLKNVDCNINGSIDDENCMPSKSKLYWKQYLLKESEKQ